MNGMRAFFWATNHTSTGMSHTPLGHGPRKVFDRQRWRAILTLALRGSWSQAGDGLIGLVADVQPPTGPAGLGWGLQCTALLGQNCDREDGLGSPCWRPERLGCTFSSSSSSLSEPGSVEIPQG